MERVAPQAWWLRLDRRKEHPSKSMTNVGPRSVETSAVHASLEKWKPRCSLQETKTVRKFGQTLKCCIIDSNIFALTTRWILLKLSWEPHGGFFVSSMFVLVSQCLHSPILVMSVRISCAPLFGRLEFARAGRGEGALRSGTEVASVRSIRKKWHFYLKFLFSEITANSRPVHPIRAPNTYTW